MKKNLFYLFALVCAMSLFTACSDDDEVKCPIPQTVDFTAESGLSLTYNGEAMPGKKVSFVPDAKDAAKATLILSGNLDLSGLLTRANAPAMTGAGVFPGSRVTSIPVTLDIQGAECSFAGESETDYCTFSYSGKASSSSMRLDLTNVTLKNDALAATTWIPTPVKYEGFSYVEGPSYVVWEAEKQVEPFPGFALGMGDILNMVLRGIPVIAVGDGQKVTVEAMLCNVLRDITLGADGNISASYIDAANGGTSVVKTPAHVAQYVVLNDSQLKVYLNLDAIIASMRSLAASTKAIDITAAIESLLPLVTDGVPLSYSKADGKMTVYLNTELLLPLLKGVVAPLFMDEEFVAQLVEAMKADPDFGGMAGMAEGMLKSLPEVINTTSKVEIGLNLTAAE